MAVQIMKKTDFYFAQLSDIHIGTNPKPDDARLQFQWALSELQSFETTPEILLMTGDLVCNGRRDELEEFKEVIKDCTIPWRALAANHDLWGEKDDSAWKECIGELRSSVVVGEFKFILFNDITDSGNGWKVSPTEADYKWLESELESTGNKNIIVAIHNPPSSESHVYSRWQEKDAEKLLKLLAKYKVTALISGDYHVNEEWEREGVRIINTGALVGMFYNGLGNFPLKPGYRIFHWDGETLRSFWREGSYWTLPPAPEKKQMYCAEFELYSFCKRQNLWWPIPLYERIQVSLTHFGNVGTGGPHPIVRPMHIFGKTVIKADAFSQHLDIAKVEWSLDNDHWFPMKQVWKGIWEHYEAEFDPAPLRNGEYLCKVRATGSDGSQYYDVVPVIISGPRNAPRIKDAVFAGATQLFNTMLAPYD